MLYVIDGYNLLHRLADLKPSNSDEMEDQRLKLIRRLIGFSAGKQLQFQLVFDAPPDRRGRENHPGVRVDYASPSADDFIRHIIVKNQGSRQIVIVTSDRKDIGEYARSCGLTWLEAETFWKQFSSARKNPSHLSNDEHGNAPSEWSSADTEWLRKAFEDHDRSL